MGKKREGEYAKVLNFRIQTVIGREMKCERESGMAQVYQQEKTCINLSLCGILNVQRRDNHRERLH